MGIAVAIPAPMTAPTGPPITAPPAAPPRAEAAKFGEFSRVRSPT